MTAAELTTAVQEGANVKVAIMNNHFLGMVRQWQEFFFEKRYSAVNMLTPDFVKLADAHGVPARRVKELTPELFKGQIERIANNYVFYASWFK